MHGYQGFVLDTEIIQENGFKKRAGTTSKVAIPQAVREEIELVFLHEIAYKAEKYKIPHSLILNLDQTPTKFAPG